MEYALLELAKQFATFFLIFLVLERLFALYRGQAIFRKGWITDVIHFFATQLFAAMLVGLTGYITAALFERLINYDFQALIRSQTQWLQFIEMLVLVELGAYTYHRLSHKILFLWKFHAIHHSSEALDWLAASRFHPLDLTFSRTFKYTPLIFFGFSVEYTALMIFFDFFHGLFIHSNVWFRFGPLNRFIVTPEFHHWHHADEVIAHDKNFGGLLPWFDVLFGTYHMPKNRIPEKYGVSDEVGGNYLKHLAYPFSSRAWRKTPPQPVTQAVVTADELCLTKS